MHGLLYISFATRSMSRQDLREIRDASILNNGPEGITGILFYQDGMFLQVLEGERAALDELLDRLRRDCRHRGLTILLDEPIQARSFPDWAMALGDADRLTPEDRLLFRSLASAGPSADTPLAPVLHRLISEFRRVVAVP